MKAHDYILFGSAILLAALFTLILVAVTDLRIGIDDHITQNQVNIFTTIEWFVMFFGVALILMGIVKYFLTRKEK